MKLLYFLCVIILTITACKKSKETAKINLSSPVNGSSITTSGDVKFTWSSTIPNPTAGPTYKIRITEIIANESPEDAMRTNKPFFEKDSIERLFFSYPPSSPTLRIDRKYAWKVLTSTNVAAKDSSAIAWFVAK